jgi:ketosteroid isomerase-like protein
VRTGEQALATGSGNGSSALRVLQTLSSGVLAQLEGLLDEGIVMELPFVPSQFPQSIEGREAVLQALAYIPSAFDFFRLNVHELYECATRDCVICEATAIGRRRGGGSFYQNRYVFVLRFKDGKVVLWREFLNPLRIH